MAAAIMTVAVASFTASTLAQSRYPEIDAAEASLRSALASLGNAPDVFDGYKRGAEQLINQAIGQLENGKKFAAATAKRH
jgi:predicted metal-dependent hydrolase